MESNRAQSKALKIETILRSIYTADNCPTASEIRLNPYKSIEDALEIYQAGNHMDKMKQLEIDGYQKEYRGLINNDLDSLIETDDADSMINELDELISKQQPTQ